MARKVKEPPAEAAKRQLKEAMGRKPMAAREVPDPLPGQLGLATKYGRDLRWTVVARPLKAAPVFALVMEEGWAGTRPELDDLADSAAEFAGAYVRLHPPAGAADAVVESARKALLGLGARAVRVVARRRGAVVLPAKRAPAVRATIRATAEGMVDEANTQDREALRAIVVGALNEVGL